MKRIVIFVFLFNAIFLFSAFSQTECGTRISNYSYSLNDAAFLNDSTVIVIGGDGIIMKSNDFGKTWKNVNSGTYSDLSKIQFLTPSVGYILGSSDLLLRTNDSGESWFKIPVDNPGYPYATDIYFLTPDTGYVVGEEGEIFKTYNGGRTWHYRKVGHDDLASVFFINSKIGFTCGRSNTLLKTIDCGKTWENINMDDFGWNLGFMDVFFTSENDGFLITNEGQVIKTTDQGVNWDKIAEIPTDFATKIYFVNENIGYAIGGWISPTFYKTINSGLNWKTVNYSSSGSFSGIALNKTGERGIIVGNTSGLGSSSAPGHVILSSNDGGNNWETQSYLEGDKSFFDVFFVDDSLGYVFGGDSRFEGGCGFRTKNQGQTWKKLDFRSKSGIRKCVFINKDLGFIASDSLYKTEDGGDTWKSTFDDFVTSISFINQDTGFCTVFIHESKSSIIRTFNSGKSWEEIKTVTFWFNDLKFIDDSIGFAVGYNTAFKTTNYGTTWTPLNEINNLNLQTVYPINQDTIFVAGSDGVLYYSYDSGLNWKEANFEASMDIVDLFFYGDSYGIAITNNGGSIGEVYLSYDFGQSWTRTQQLPDNIYKYSHLDNGKGFFVGEGGRLMKFEQNNSPIFPSYIIGDTLVLKDSSYNYNLLYYDGENTNWNADKGNILEILHDSIKITWSDTGRYSFTLSLENNCGMSSEREFKVHVLDSLAYYDKIFTTARDSFISVSGKVFTETGTYQDTLLNSVGCDSIITINLIIENINTVEVAQLFPVSIYPNPTTGDINVKLGRTNRDVNIELYDLEGRIISSNNYKNVKQFDYHIKLASGLYFLKIVDDKKRITIKKIIIE